MAVREEPTLRRAMEAMARYMRLHNEALVTRVEEAEGPVMIREDLIDRAAVPLRQSTELVIGVLFRTLQLFLGAGWKPRSICFTHGPPASTATHRRLFGMPVLFHREFDGIVCRAAELETPLPGYDAAIAQQVRQYMDAMLAQSSSSMADKVRELVLAMLPLGICSVERIAGQLDVDRRTVHHHLSARGELFLHPERGARRPRGALYREPRAAAVRGGDPAGLRFAERLLALVRRTVRLQCVQVADTPGTMTRCGLAGDAGGADLHQAAHALHGAQWPQALTQGEWPLQAGHARGKRMFPEYREQISVLKTQDAHFARLFDRHNELDQQIKNMEAGIVPADELAIEQRKKEKLHLKDQLYVILRKTAGD